MTIRAALVILAIPVLTAQANTSGRGASAPVSHGTINVILADSDGIVVLTDSMITAGSRQLREPGQKLFRLDDHTVCTIAGFVSAFGPVPDLYTSTSAIIQQYVKQSVQQSPQTIEEKLNVLARLFMFYLSSIEQIRSETGMATPGDRYAFQLTVVGYDTDGVGRIGQILLDSVEANGLFRSEIKAGSVIDVGTNFVAKLAGIPDVADRLLRDPGSAPNDAVLADYASAIRRDEGRSLTVLQMKKIAARLAWYTARAYPSVGGPNQVATLQNGHIESIEQQAFAEPTKAPLQFSLFVADRISGSGIVFGQAARAVFLRTTFTGYNQSIDRHYFWLNTFNNCVLRYDGGELLFDKNNRLTDCGLVLGPHVNPKDQKVRHLVADFHWARGVYQELVPSSP